MFALCGAHSWWTTVWLENGSGIAWGEGWSYGGYLTLAAMDLSPAAIRRRAFQHPCGMERSGGHVSYPTHRTVARRDRNAYSEKTAIRVNAQRSYSSGLSRCADRRTALTGRAGREWRQRQQPCGRRIRSNCRGACGKAGR